MDFKWIGDQVLPPSSFRLHNRSYYSSCEWNGKIYNAADFVLISNADATDSEHLSDCYVGQILHMYHAVSRKTDPYRAVVQWYSRIKQLPKLPKTSLQSIEPHLNQDWELVHEGRTNNGDISIETIFGKSDVLHCSPTEVPSSKIGLKKNLQPTFFARFQLIKNPYRLLPIQEMEVDDNENSSGTTPLTKRRRKTPLKYIDDELLSPPKNCDFTVLRATELSPIVQKRKSNTPESSKTVRKKLALDETPSVQTSITGKSATKTKSSTKDLLHNTEKVTPAKTCTEVGTPRTRGRRKKLEDVYPPSRDNFSPIPEEDSVILSGNKRAQTNAKDNETPTKLLPRRRGRPPKSPSVNNIAAALPQQITPLKSSETTPMKTPSSAGRPKSASNQTPVTLSRKRKLEMTPRLPQRSASISTPKTPLSEARRKLHVSAVPVSLPCREQEFAGIYTFVEDKLVSESGGCMYISGVPGTGKTATVQEVIRILRERHSEGDLPDFQIVELNGMKMTTPHQVYAFIWQELTKEKVPAEHALTLLDHKFSRPAPRRPSTVLIVDELDLLWTKKQDVLYNLFDWPSRAQAKLIVLAISNTMDLPERLLMNRVASRLGLTRLTFHPYTVKQLQSIVTSRLEELDCFDSDAVEFVARKVSAVSGDARRALDICRRAAEIAEKAAGVTPRKRGAKAAAVKITMANVDAAIQEMFSSPKYLAMQACSLHEQFFLQAMVAEYSRTGIEESVFSRVVEHHFVFCDLEGVSRPNISELLNVCANLSASRLIIAQHGRYDLLQKIRLNVNSDDVTYAMKQLKTQTTKLNNK